MLGGAIVVLISGQISIPEALGAINTDVMLFLFGMFIVGEAMVESGYLSLLSCRFFSHARTPDQLIIFILFGMGLFSAVLMNDTLAIIGTPLVLSLATEFPDLTKTDASFPYNSSYDRQCDESYR